MLSCYSIIILVSEMSRSKTAMAYVHISLISQHSADSDARYGILSESLPGNIHARRPSARDEIVDFKLLIL